MQARAQSSASPPSRTRRGFLSTVTNVPPILPSTQPISTQEILPARAETAAAAKDRDMQHMRSVMHGTREAGALAAVRSSSDV